MAVSSRVSLLLMAIVVVLATVANAQAPAPTPTSDGNYSGLLCVNVWAKFAWMWTESM